MGGRDGWKCGRLVRDVSVSYLYNIYTIRNKSQKKNGGSMYMTRELEA